MEEEVPLKIIELSDFLRSPSLLSQRLEFKQTKTEESSSDQRQKNRQESDRLKLKTTQPNVVLLRQKAISTDNREDQEYCKQKELIIPKDIIVFADDVDREKIGLFNRSKTHFSRHLLVTSGAALQALIPPLTNATEWIVVCKLKYSKLYTKELPTERNVIISLNIKHPFVRYEILTAFDLLQQSFNEIKSAYIMIDFSQILSRWFKNYLQRTDQYPSLSNRILFRYQIRASKCSITLGKRQFHQDKNYYRFRNNRQKFLYKSNIPMQIYINFNSLPTIVYSIQLNNIFIYSMNDEYKQILKDIGNGLSLVSVQSLNPCEIVEEKANNCNSLVQKEENFCQGKNSAQEKNSAREKNSAQVKEEIKSCSPSSYELSEQEKILFEKLWDNRMRIQTQHQQLMTRASRLLCFSSINNDSFCGKNTQLNHEPNLQIMKSIHY
ncbi:unnamed protein product [Rotaria sordida]|uniref:Uncharacterized protein n=1 Tax=Rotaria sordida TaxID=392033 RepID=A0A814B3H2_9BILA|nr:unnamed protein product [Rotaria sordida]CAF0922742.1 unnamed protein product [Rotaria sordida]CAF3912864.1 unnamed protein product [Rotaria sordida]CAF3974952.1 unnamed protein product [Rotaria sordida]